MKTQSDIILKQVTKEKIVFAPKMPQSKQKSLLTKLESLIQ